MHTLTKMNLTLKPTPIQRLNRISEEYGCNIFGSITNFVGFPIPLVALSAHIE